MSYNLVIFDLDGTLLDTLRDLGDSTNRVLAAHGYPVHPLEAYRYFVGDGIANLARRALPESARDNITVECVRDAMSVDYAEHWADTTRPYDGIPELLQALETQGIRKAVFSNKPDPFTQATVARLLAGFRFDRVVGAREGQPIKPDPSGALMIARELDVEPAACVYVGDTSTDMRTGTSAGMYTIGVTWGFRPRTELEAHGAQAIIDQPMELMELIRANA